jgi:hypothetical protein
VFVALLGNRCPFDAVIAVWINWQLARDRPGRMGWRRGL